MIMAKEYPVGFEGLKPQDFDAADDWFEANEDEVKYSRKDEFGHSTDRNFSFLRAPDEMIYAVQDTHSDKEAFKNTFAAPVGMYGYDLGGSAAVKRVVNLDGKEFALRISTIRGAQRYAYQILIKLGLLRAVIERESQSKKEFFIDRRKKLAPPVKVYEILEFAPGKDFYDYLRESADKAEEMPFLARLQIALSMLKAVEVIHDQDIIHGDLKSKNMRLDVTSNTIKLVDFQHSKELEGKPSIVGAPCGTVAYLAFELCFDHIIKEKKCVHSKASDVFALGVILTGHYFLNLQRDSLGRVHMAYAPDGRKDEDITVGPSAMWNVHHYYTKESIGRVIPLFSAQEVAENQPLKSILSTMVSRHPNDRGVVGEYISKLESYMTKYQEVRLESEAAEFIPKRRNRQVGP